MNDKPCQIEFLGVFRTYTPPAQVIRVLYCATHKAGFVGTGQDTECVPVRLEKLQVALAQAQSPSAGNKETP